MFQRIHSSSSWLPIMMLTTGGTGSLFSIIREDVDRHSNEVEKTPLWTQYYLNRTSLLTWRKAEESGSLRASMQNWTRAVVCWRCAVQVATSSRSRRSWRSLSRLANSTRASSLRRSTSISSKHCAWIASSTFTQLSYNYIIIKLFFFKNQIVKSDLPEHFLKNFWGVESLLSHSLPSPRAAEGIE